MDLSAYVIAHQGHQGEGSNDGELVDEGDGRAGDLGHGLPVEVLLHHQGQEGQQEHRSEVQHEFVVLRTEESLPEDDIDADGSDQADDGDAEDDCVVDKVLSVSFLLCLVPASSYPIGSFGEVVTQRFDAERSIAQGPAGIV